jgi:hypothetical protein
MWSNIATLASRKRYYSIRAIGEWIITGVFTELKLGFGISIKGGDSNELMVVVR